MNLNRRQLLQLAAVSTGTFALSGCGGGSGGSGGGMPDEGAAHERTWMAFTTSRAIWGGDLRAVQNDLAQIANTIAAFEPVSMLVNASDRAAAESALAGLPQRGNVTLIDGPVNDLWMRDTGPVFARSGSGLVAVDFNFNGWGNKQVHNLDAQVAGFVAGASGVPALKSSLVLEGGGIEVDGEGTAIIRESCVLNGNRNPGVSKAACEAELGRALGLSRFIWLPGPAGGDITDGHTDFYARFASPGTVAVSHDANNVWGERAVTQAHIDVLRGHGLQVEIIPTPDNPSSSRSYDADFAAGYINYYVCNGAVIMQRFGDAAADERARAAIAALHPGRSVVQLQVDGIAAGGGGIHCTTQQQPR